jgi:carbamoyl-phosphate synthase large subunit
LDLAEDRGRFRNFNGVKHSIPQFGIAETADEAAALADTLDFHY